MVQFAESNFKFTDPIRFFKANDPIYYEVDNIPLKQLQENDLWLKDQIEKLDANFQSTTVQVDNGITRDQLLELKPFTEGIDSVVQVMPGRYTARINDAYDITRMQKIIALPDTFRTFSQFQFDTNATPYIQNILNKFKTYQSSNFLGMNGLYERAYTFPMFSNREVSQYLQRYIPQFSTNPGAENGPYPNVIGGDIVAELGGTQFSSVTTPSWTASLGHLALVRHETEFIKAFRGVTRTAIVDVPNILTIEIPEFNPADFFYINENNERVILPGASQRIDLLFIYSKSIDVSSTTIPTFDNSTNPPTPRKLTQPALGIVKGAGVGISHKTSTNINQTIGAAGSTDVNIVDDDGNPIIAANPSDELRENTGFTISGVNIRGSFPSPDDLMNLSPLIAEQLESDHIALIGQSILPIAYIVVKESATRNQLGQRILTNSDIIDIRPFFRTTELSYNERAGIAAATPQISIVNPVATEAYVDLSDKKIYDYIDSVPQPIRDIIPPAATINFPRILYSNYIFGGTKWGPEAAIDRLALARGQYAANDPDRNQRLRNYIGIGRLNGRVVNSLPEWDLATWCKSPFPTPGDYPNDYINFAQRVNNVGNEFFADSKADFGFDIFPDGIESTNAWAFNSHYQAYAFFWVSKTFRVNAGNVPGLIDIDVDAKFFNCIPSNCNETTYEYTHNTVNGIWYSKKGIDANTWDVTIHVGWGAPIMQGNRERVYPPYSRATNFGGVANSWKGLYTGFLVMNREMEIHTPRRTPRNGLGTYGYLIPGFPSQGSPAWNADSPGAPGPIGISKYPSVSFNLIGRFSNGTNNFGVTTTLPSGKSLGQGNYSVITL